KTTLNPRCSTRIGRKYSI
ncbi:hypothetical protein D043_0198B, partial [Vibrio parahaemolyticus EKP-021]